MSQSESSVRQYASTSATAGLVGRFGPAADEGQTQDGNRARTRGTFGTLAKILSPLASLRLTIVLLTALMVLIFCGTWAQRSQGIWLVMDQYFRAWLVMIPLNIFNTSAAGGPGSVGGRTIPGEFPWPGGATLGVLLLINLVAAHAVRFKIKARGARLGLGLALLVVGTTLIVWFHAGSAIGALLGGAGYLPMLLVGLLIYLPAIAAAAVIFGKRFGIVLIHGSLILLLAGEFITRTTSVETQMPIYEGQTVSYSQDMREGELAVIRPDAAGKAQEHVVAIPEAMMRKSAKTGEPIRTDALPFAISVKRWMRNSAFVKRGGPMGSANTPSPPFMRGQNSGPDLSHSHNQAHDQAHTPAKPPADVRGLGKTYRLRPMPQVSGVGGGDVNFPGAIVRLVPDVEPPDKKQNASSSQSANAKPRLGTYLLSARTMTMDTLYEYKRQPVTVDGTRYELSLRFRRHYPPYAMTLKDFEHDNYPGTQVPSSYASQLQLVNPQTGEDRPVRIEMNEPLRYGGQTFYQSGYIPGDRGTVLQVVANPASSIPYIACALGGIGLLCHFCLSLARHLGKGSRIGAA